MNGWNSDSTDRINQEDYTRGLLENNKKQSELLKEALKIIADVMGDLPNNEDYYKFNDRPDSVLLCSDFIDKCEEERRK